MERQQSSCKFVEIMELRDRLAEFFKQSFQVLLCRLLSVEAKLVMKRFASASNRLGESVIGFGFANPLARRSFHTRPFPSS